jgi:sarcosine oxidase
MRVGASYDVVVVGLGAMGSATACHLARRGPRVLGLDAYPRGHALGSSHGTSRIIREAYHEAPAYVPLVQRAYTLWRELEEETGRRMLHVTGGLSLGFADGSYVAGVLESGRRYGIAVETLTAAEVRGRFPGFAPTDDLIGVYQARSGYLEPEVAGGAHLDLAARHGAELRHGDPALAWAPDGDGVRVRTAAGEHRAARLVLTAGPWAPAVLRELGLSLEARRQYNVHFEPRRPDRFTARPAGPCPVFGWRVPEGQYYGVAALPVVGLKLGRHDGGEPCTPETARREVTAAEVDALRAILDRYMPGAAGRMVQTLTCLYTMTPDGHFVIDRHPRAPQIAYAAGFSGHGFKFATVIGEVLADLATEGATRHEIGFLGARRLAASPADDRAS